MGVPALKAKKHVYCEKEMARESADLKRSQAKVGNRKFVENAPAEVVEQERLRLAAHEAKLSQLKEQARQLASLAG